MICLPIDDDKEMYVQQSIALSNILQRMVLSGSTSIMHVCKLAAATIFYSWILTYQDQLTVDE